MKSKEKIKLYLYSSFLHDSDVFENYCFDLETAIVDYKNKYNTEIKREILFFEKKCVFTVLVIISLICIIGFSVIFSKYKKMELWLFIFPLLTLWAGYFDQRNSKRLMEN